MSNLSLWLHLEDRWPRIHGPLEDCQPDVAQGDDDWSTNQATFFLSPFISTIGMFDEEQMQISPLQWKQAASSTRYLNLPSSCEHWREEESNQSHLKPRTGSEGSGKDSDGGETHDLPTRQIDK
jgi:hypothetical protein